MDVTFWIKSGSWADGQKPGRAGSFPTIGALTNGSTHAVKEGIPTVQSVHKSLVSEIADRQYRLWAFFIDNCFPFRRDLIQCLVP